ncbi:MAG: heparan-alpha-glucosaminide N-acetyltransferase domain-containing protein [Candidatus Kapaibacterium sp.]
MPLQRQASSSLPEPLSGRIRFLDAVRGIAVLLMIAVHTTDAFLALDYRSGWYWNQVNIIFGFVAPAFLFFSGVTFQLALARREEKNGSVRGIATRAVQILFLGYWLQIPSHSLRIALTASPEQVARFFDCNILQLIGGLMLLSLLLYKLVRSTAAMERGVWIGICAIVLATPLIPEFVAQGELPVFVRYWLGPEGSFPLFPFATYFLIGFALSRRMITRSLQPKGGLQLATAGLLLLLLSEGVSYVQGTLPLYSEFWANSPALVLFRIGGVLLLTGVVAYLMSKSKKREGRENVSQIERVGKTSLPIYILHLMLIYGSPVNMGMRYWYDSFLHQLMSPEEVLAIFVAVTGITWITILLWQQVEHHRPKLASTLTWCWWIGFGVLFLVA